MLQKRCATGGQSGERVAAVWKLGRAMMEYHARWEKYHDGVDYRTSRALARLGLAYDGHGRQGRPGACTEAEIRQAERDFNQGMERMMQWEGGGEEEGEETQARARGNAARMNKELKQLMAVFRRGLIGDVAALLLRSTATPDATTFNILIRRFTLFRNNVLARLAFVGMLEARVMPDAYTLSALLSLATASGNYAEFRRVVQVMNAKGVRQTIPLNLMLYGTLINGSVKFGRVDHAEMYLRACERKFEPSQPILTSMLRMYAKHGRVDEGLCIWRKLTHLASLGRFTVDGFAKEAMRQLCAVGGLSAEGLDSPAPHKTKGLTAHRSIKLPHPPTPHTPHLRRWVAKQRLRSDPGPPDDADQDPPS